jgi:hypothetical protein
VARVAFRLRPVVGEGQVAERQEDRAECNDAEQGAGLLELEPEQVLGPLAAEGGDPHGVCRELGPGSATVEEGVNVLVYVASKEASATNGASLRGDGGVALSIA